MGISRTFTLTEAAALKSYLVALAERAANHDPAFQPTLDAAVTWLGSVSGFGKRPGVRLTHAVLAGLLDGLAFPDDALLDTVRRQYIAYLQRPTPPPPPPPPSQAITNPNLLADGFAPWVSGTLTQLEPGWAAALLAFCQASPQQLVLGDLALIPPRMRDAGFQGRDNALWYSLSRSYAEWPWADSPDDPDEHLWHQQRELHDFWAGYLDAVLQAMQGAPETRAVFLLNDGPDRCGDVLSEYSLRQLSSVADRVARGDVYTSEG